MTQNVTLNPNRSNSPAPALSPDVAIYTHPEDVASDPKLTLAGKREILASWISDARTVENAPALRRLDSGAVVEVDAILRVLTSLDQITPNLRVDRRRPSPRRRSVILKWLRRERPSHKSKNNDDDPPPAPAGFGVPFRPKLVDVYGARAQLLRLACAIG